MFRHLPVSKKMAVGFGIQTALILLASLIAIVNTLYHAALFGQIDRLSELQTNISFGLKTFSEARLLSRQIVLEIDHEAYEEYAHFADTATAFVDNIEAEAQAEGNVLLPQITALAQDLRTWIDHVDSVQEYNLLLEEQLGQLEEFSRLLSEESIALYREIPGQMDAWAGSGSPPLLMAAELTREVELLRLSSARALLIFATENFTPVLEQGEVVQTLIRELESSGLPTAAQSRISTLSRLLEEYLEQLEIFYQNSEDSEILHESNVYALADSLAAQAGILSDDAEEAMSDLMAYSRRISTFSLLFTCIAALLSLSAACLVGYRITTGLTGPLTRMQRMLRQVGETGSLLFSDEETALLAQDAESRDEVGQSVAAARSLVHRLEEINGCLDRISARDLTASLEPLSPDDATGTALNNMCQNLQTMLEEIMASADAVAMAASSLAAGAQNLAQSNSEQAAAVEELDVSIGEVSGQAVAGLGRYRLALDNSRSIRGIARAGGDQMEHMVEAIREINDSARSIKQIVKAIDEIAFQTNLLSLNASIEAARAGASGRGFATVAGEVRTLATRSAEAARDTASLIAGTISHAQRGLQIAEETAGSFTEILEGVRQTAADMEDIASTTEAQTTSLQQIASGVGQISDGVQQNSAVGQETAASSEELDAQAQRMYDLVSGFRLPERDGIRSLPPSVRLNPYGYKISD